MDVARRTDPSVIRLRHEGHRHAALVRELLGTRLVDDVVVGRLQRVGVAEVDLMLPGPRLALGRLDFQPGRLHRGAHRAHERLVVTRGEDVVVEDVRHGGRQVAEMLRVRLLVALPEEEELELRAEHRLVAQGARLLELGFQDLARRRGDG